MKPFPDNDRPENPQASVFNYQGHELLCGDAAFGVWQGALCCHLPGTFPLKDVESSQPGPKQLPLSFCHPRQPVGWVGLSRIENPAYLTLIVGLTFGRCSCPHLRATRPGWQSNLLLWVSGLHLQDCAELAHAWWEMTGTQTPMCLDIINLQTEEIPRFRSLC